MSEEIEEIMEKLEEIGEKIDDLIESNKPVAIDIKCYKDWKGW